VVDLTVALGDHPPRELLDEILVAARETGIIQVVGHGVDQALIGEFSRRAGRLLSLPRAEKANLASPTGHPHRGWRQWPDDFGRLELERFSIGQFDNPADARAAGIAGEHLALYAHSNVWPPDDPQLRDVAFRYIDASRRVAERALRLYARVLGFPDDTFRQSPLPYLTLTVNDYPTWSYPDAADEDKLLLLEHADGSAVTVLSQEGDYEGLQVQLPDGDWLPVPIIPGALQIFSGTLLTRWTNGYLRPARHRVVAGGTVTRRSAAVFYHPSLGTVLEPLAPFIGIDGTEYEPVLLWDLLRDDVEDYMKVFGRPEQVTAWRQGRPYVAPLAENSAGRLLRLAAACASRSRIDQVARCLRRTRPARGSGTRRNAARWAAGGCVTGPDVGAVTLIPNHTIITGKMARMGIVLKICTIPLNRCSPLDSRPPITPVTMPTLRPRASPMAARRNEIARSGPSTPCRHSCAAVRAIAVGAGA
jgi:isopenicillin N synthase-like dioxygenase